jgi:hypothetical protein
MTAGASGSRGFPRIADPVWAACSVGACFGGGSATPAVSDSSYLEHPAARVSIKINSILIVKPNVAVDGRVFAYRRTVLLAILSLP